MRTLEVYEDANGSHLTNIIAPSDNVNHLMFASVGTQKMIAVPAEANYVIFQSFNEFYVNIGSAASVPSVDLTDGSGSIPVPLGLFVRPADEIHIVTAESNARVTVMFFKRG